MMALDNQGYYQTFTGVLLLSTAIGEAELDGFLNALERSLHLLGYVGDGAERTVALAEGTTVD